MTRFHIWRPATALFWYPLSPQTGFHFLINLYFLYNYRCFSYLISVFTFRHIIALLQLAPRDGNL